MHYIANRPDLQALCFGIARQGLCGSALKMASIALICRVAYQEHKSG